MTQQWGAPSGQQGYGQSPPGYGSGRQQWGAPAQQSQWGQQGQWGAPQQRQPQWGQGPQQGSQGYQQGSPYQPGQFKQPPKKSNSGLIKMIAGAMAVILLLFIGFSVLGGKTGGTANGGPYKNEDYKAPPPQLNPPEIPMPKTYDEATQWLEKNNFYKQSIETPIRCEISEINILTASTQALKSHMDDLTACLMKLWDAPVKAAGSQMYRPISNVYSGKANSACGVLPPSNAVYCSADQQIYYSPTLPRVLPADLRSKRFVVEAIIAHEVGHALQGRTGLLISAHAWIQKYGRTSGQGLELSRRLEVQADCFSGMFMGAISQSVGMNQGDLDTILKVAVAIGDDTLKGDPNVVGNHGRGASRKYWMQLGMASTSVGVCNTFVAPKERVK